MKRTIKWFVKPAIYFFNKERKLLWKFETESEVNATEGHHEIRVVKEGYSEWKKDINVTSDMLGNTYNISVELKTIKMIPGFEFVFVVISMAIAVLFLRWLKI